MISFCDPVERSIDHWHIVTDAKDMYQKALEVLNDPDTDYSSVLVNDMETSAGKLMQLYNLEL